MSNPIQYIKNKIRINRAGRIAGYKSELDQLKEKSHKYDEDRKRINKLKSIIAKDEERQKIASENNLKSKQTTKYVSYNNTKTLNNGINTKVEFKKSKK